MADKLQCGTHTAWIAPESGITVSNHLAFVTLPGQNYIPVMVQCGDAIPRMIAGRNWDGRIIIYCPSLTDGTAFTQNILYIVI